MAESNDEELEPLQRDVQRLLGRCLLRLQQYERLLKSLVAHQELAGAAPDVQAVREARVKDAARKTLGSLVGEFLGTGLVTGASDSLPEADDDPDDGGATVRVRMQVILQADDFARVERDFRDLLKLRNGLVHHFIEQHDIGSAVGCLTARADLIDAFDRIDRCYGDLRNWAHDFALMEQSMPEILLLDIVRDLVIRGVAPDGTVDWPASSLVSGFREAARALVRGGDGWVSVVKAGDWLVAKHPDQKPERFGCKSWRQALHQSRLFDLRYDLIEGRRVLCFRERANPKPQDSMERRRESDGEGKLK